MKGRNTTVISIRIPDSVYHQLDARSGVLSVNEYVRQVVINSLRSVYHRQSPELDADGRIIHDAW